MPQHIVRILCCIVLLAHTASAIRPHAAPQQLTAALAKKKELNNRPIVGILTQAGLPEDKFVPKDGTYIAASYVKFIESGGARVVPILADTPADVVGVVMCCRCTARYEKICNLVHLSCFTLD